jgi:hypothetical protein
MGTQKTRDLPARLEGLRLRFERWRGTHKPRSRISETLWGSAVKMAGMYGLHRTAKALRLDYYVLKKHVEHGPRKRVGCALKKRIAQEGIALADRPKKGVAAFFELTPPPFVGACECTLDLENAGGAKMRVHLKSITMPDLAALSQSFWNSQS